MHLDGQFLISTPGLVDPNFRRTVVLLLEHNDEHGTLGLVINRPGPIGVGLFCAGLGIKWIGESNFPVYIGGPVQPMVGWLLHEPIEEAPDSRVILDGLCVSNSRETLMEIASRRDVSRRLFAGYAGWGPGQLNTEMRSGAWITTDAVPDLVFDSEVGRMWNGALLSMGLDPLSLVPGATELS